MICRKTLVVLRCPQFANSSFGLEIFLFENRILKPRVPNELCGLLNILLGSFSGEAYGCLRLSLFSPMDSGWSRVECSGLRELVQRVAGWLTDRLSVGLTG